MFAVYLNALNMAKKEHELENIAWALKSLEAVQSAADALIFSREMTDQSPEMAELMVQIASRLDAVLHTERTTLEYYKKLTEERK